MSERTEREQLELDVSIAVMATADRVKLITSIDPNSLSPAQLTSLLTACSMFESMLDNAGFKPA